MTDTALRGRRLRRLIAVLAGLLALAGCGLTGQPVVPTAPLPSLSPPAAAAADRVVVEPEDGMGAVYALLAAPRRTLDLTMYELADPQAEQVLAADAARGVRVRVLLDRNLEGRRNTPAAQYLAAHHVSVVFASARYAATHEKAFVIDGTTTVVLSLNLTARYYPTTRDFAVVDHSPADAAAAGDVFAADVAGRAVGTPRGDDLVWSPGASQADLLTLVGSARRSLWVESEEFSSRPLIAALVAAARRGVDVHLVMTYQADWRAGFTALAAAGGHVVVYHGEHPLYIHAKAIAVDPGNAGQRAFVGSENLAAASLLRDRELGIVLLAPAQVAAVAAVLESDAAGGAPWQS